MLIPSDPVVLFSPDGRRSKRFAAIDAPGWLSAGWSLAPIEKPMLEKKDSIELTLSPSPESSTEVDTFPEIPPTKAALTTPTSKPEGKKK